MIPFSDRAQEMGLNVDLAYKGMFSYADQYSEVVYRTAATLYQDEDPTPHATDAMDLPMIGIYTKSPNSEVYKYAGYVSQLYKFIGNDVLNQRIRDAILSVGMPIMRENPILSDYYTRMRNEIIIQNSQQVADVGDVMPVMIVNNSYDGTKAASISFGISTYYDSQSVTFAFKLGEIRQVHIASSNTSMASAANSYMQVFAENITDMITQSFSSRLTEEEMLGTLDVIEGVGKKRREEISELLSQIQQESGNEMPTAWQMFLAIVRYSSFEPNLNVKRMLENAAESVLVIPQRMYEVLEQLENS